MSNSIPTVRDGVLLAVDAAGPPIHLDTPAWFAWLEDHTTNRFSYALHNRAQGYIDGFMTVRKERRQRGTAYWAAYRRQGQRLCKLYIGRSHALTQARLEEIAARLRPRDGPAQTHTFCVPTRVSGLLIVNHHCWFLNRNRADLTTGIYTASCLPLAGS